MISKLRRALERLPARGGGLSLDTGVAFFPVLLEPPLTNWLFCFSVFCWLGGAEWLDSACLDLLLKRPPLEVCRGSFTAAFLELLGGNYENLSSLFKFLIDNKLIFVSVKNTSIYIWINSTNLSFSSTSDSSSSNSSSSSSSDSSTSSSDSSSSSSSSESTEERWREFMRWERCLGRHSGQNQSSVGTVWEAKPPCYAFGHSNASQMLEKHFSKKCTFSFGRTQ